MLHALCAMPYAPCAMRQNSQIATMTERGGLPNTVSNGGLGVLAVYSTIAWWLATVAWAALIFHLSTPAFGADRSIPILGGLLAFLYVSLSHTTLDLLDTFIRKLAHLTEYAIFALLLYRSCRGSTTLPAAGGLPRESAAPLSRGRLPARCGWRPGVAFWCIVIATLYSATDEYHQSFTPNRVPSALDCVIDTTGAAVGMLLTYFAVRFSSSRTSPVPRQHYKREDAKAAKEALF
jgi:VanZ family protein